MNRAVALSLLAALGCGSPSSTVDRHVEGLTSPELRFRVVMTEITRSYPAIAVHATVMSSTAEWAALHDLGLGDALLPSADLGGSGPARRLRSGLVELDVEPSLLPLEAWGADREYERRYAVVLDAPPTEPWDVVLSVTISGHPTGTANAEIVLDP